MFIRQSAAGFGWQRSQSGNRDNLWAYRNARPASATARPAASSHGPAGAASATGSTGGGGELTHQQEWHNALVDQLGPLPQQDRIEQASASMTQLASCLTRRHHHRHHQHHHKQQQQGEQGQKKHQRHHRHRQHEASADAHAGLQPCDPLHKHYHFRADDSRHRHQQTWHQELVHRRAARAGDSSGEASPERPQSVYSPDWSDSGGTVRPPLQPWQRGARLVIHSPVDAGSDWHACKHHHHHHQHRRHHYQCEHDRDRKKESRPISRHRHDHNSLRGIASPEVDDDGELTSTAPFGGGKVTRKSSAVSPFSSPVSSSATTTTLPGHGSSSSPSASSSPRTPLTPESEARTPSSQGSDYVVWRRLDVPQEKSTTVLVSPIGRRSPKRWRNVDEARDKESGKQGRVCTRNRRRGRMSVTADKDSDGNDGLVRAENGGAGLKSNHVDCPVRTHGGVKHRARRKPLRLSRIQHVGHERVRINVSGMYFETWRAVLDSHPTTLLGNPAKREGHFDAVRKEYFFDRHRPTFEAIFNYYQYGGKLKRPGNVPDEIFLSELQFYEIESEVIESYKKDEGYVQEHIVLPDGRIQRLIWMLFEFPDTSKPAFIIAIFSVICTIVSIVLFCVETLPRYSATHCDKGAAPNFLDTFFILETVCTFWFTLEVIIRFAVCPSRRRFVLDMKNAVDVAAVIPYYVTLTNVLISFSCEGAKSSASLAFLRVIRLIRVFKLTKHSSGLQVLVLTFRASLEGLGVFLVALVVSIILFSSTLYYVEMDVAESQIESIPDAFWWAITTMCTVGYGDKVPKSMYGKFVGSVCALSGVLALAIPVPIITENFNKFYAHKTGRVRL